MIAHCHDNIHFVVDFYQNIRQITIMMRTLEMGNCREIAIDNP